MTYPQASLFPPFMDESDSNTKNTKQYKPNKPILGFSTWSTQLLDKVPGYGGKHVTPWFNEENIKQISDVMKQRFPSYTYINLDSGWSDGVDEFGRWTYRKDLFPNGLRAVSDYLAKNGHKLGLYILPGIRAEAAVGAKRIYNTDLRIADVVVNRREGNGFKGSTFAPDLHNSFVQQYYDSIADQFAEWGVGYVKVDGCGPGGGDPWYPFQSPDNRECLTMMSKGFHRHNIWMEISWYLDPSYAEDWVNICNGVRIYVDIESYSTSTMTTPYRIFQRMALSEKWAATGLVGGEYGMFVDLDIVAVGMTVKDQCIDGLWDDSIRLSYISFWALVSSVFCLGADPRAIPDTYVKMLNHPDILYIHQSGIMAQPIGSGDASKNRKQVWWKKLPDGRTCVGLFNAHLYPVIYGVSHEVSFSFADIGLTSGTLFDVWEGTDLGHHTDVYKVILTSGACQVLFVTPSE